MLSKDISENAAKAAQNPYTNALDGKVPMPQKAFGKWMAKLAKGERGPVVKFYDLSADHSTFPEGQHVSDYYVKTLLGMDGYSDDIRFYSALLLYGNNDGWTINQPELTQIGNWLEKMTEGSL